MLLTAVLQADVCAHPQGRRSGDFFSRPELRLFATGWTGAADWITTPVMMLSAVAGLMQAGNGILAFRWKPGSEH